MTIDISISAKQLGEKAANKASEILHAAIQDKGKARLMLATGQSHFEFYEALLNISIPWEKVEIFHLDEYIGIPSNHKASFRNYLNTRFISKINPGEVHLIDTDVGADEIIAKLTEKLLLAPIDLGIVGIGENAHIAFNDPPADFDNKQLYRVVELDELCRTQQVNEGWFSSLEEVPEKAISATVQLILSSRAIVSVVPHKVKAKAVKDTLEFAEITNMVPSTILRTHNNWFLYLDEHSASLLERSKIRYN